MGQIGRGGIPVLKDKDNLHHNDVDVKRDESNVQHEIIIKEDNQITADVPQNNQKLDETARCLSTFRRNDFHFRCLDYKEEKKPPINRVLTSPLGLFKVQKANNAGFDSFFIPQVTDGKGGADKNVIEICTLFLDLDGAPLQPVLDTGVTPHAIVETSAGRFQVYWLVSDVSVKEFPVYQKALAIRFSGDISVHNASRLMRLPGFNHLKDPSNPFLSKLIQHNPDVTIYEKGQLVSGLTLDLSAPEFQPDSRKVEKSSVAIPEGSRNETIFKLVCSLWEQGRSQKYIHEKAQEENKKCTPPLAEREVRKIVTSAIRRYKQGTPQTTGLLLNGDRFSPADWIEALRKKHHLIHHNEKFHCYDDGYYKPISDLQLSATIEGLGGPELLQRNFKEIHYKLAVKLVGALGDKEVDNSWLLNLKNGWIDLKDPSYALRPHSPEVYSTFKNSFGYNPGAVCPLTDNFLNTQYPGEDLQKLIWEMIGYLLIPSTKFQVGFFIKGPSQTGKSTLLEVIEYLLTPQRVSNLSLSEFGDRFALSQTEGKLANICSETAHRGQVSDDYVKWFISGESIKVEQKFEKGKSIKPTARVLISSNKFPQTSDSTDAFFRRWIMIPANIKVTKKDPDLKYKIRDQELEGILKKALFGLMRLLEQNHFTETESSLALKDEWLDQVDLVHYWAKHRLIKDGTGSGVIWSSLVDDCNNFLDKENFKVRFTRRGFNQKMRDLGYETAHSNEGDWLRSYRLAQ